MPIERCRRRPRTGFDHTVQGAYAVAAGVARVLDLDVGKTASAIAISGTALDGLRVTRTGKLSHWKVWDIPIWLLAPLPSSFWLG